MDPVWYESLNILYYKNNKNNKGHPIPTLRAPG